MSDFDADVIEQINNLPSPGTELTTADHEAINAFTESVADSQDGGTSYVSPEDTAFAKSLEAEPFQEFTLQQPLQRK